MYERCRLTPNVDDKSLTFDLFIHESDLEPANTLKLFGTAETMQKFKNGYCRYCLLEKGELVPLKIEEVYGNYSMFPVLIRRKCDNGHKFI